MGEQVGSRGLRPELGGPGLGCSRGQHRAQRTWGQGLALSCPRAWQDLPSLKLKRGRLFWLQEWRRCPGRGRGEVGMLEVVPEDSRAPSSPESQARAHGGGTRGRGEGRLHRSARAQIFPQTPVCPRPKVALPALRSVEMTAPQRSTRCLSASLRPSTRPGPQDPGPAPHSPHPHPPGRTSRPRVPPDCPPLSLWAARPSKCPQSPG